MFVKTGIVPVVTLSVFDQVQNAAYFEVYNTLLCNCPVKIALLVLEATNQKILRMLRHNFLAGIHGRVFVKTESPQNKMFRQSLRLFRIVLWPHPKLALWLRLFAFSRVQAASRVSRQLATPL